MIDFRQGNQRQEQSNVGFSNTEVIGKDKARSVVLFLSCRFELNVHVVIRHRNTPTLELVILVLNGHNCLILAPLLYWQSVS